MPYKVVIVDDERINIEIARKFIVNKFTELEIVGEGATVEQLVSLANSLNPDILLLDVNLGKNEVFDVLHHIRTNPKIIFISSAQNYAIDAFRFNAIDFILKPLKLESFESAILKAIKRIELERNKNNLKPENEDEGEGEVVSFNKLKSKFITVSSIDKHDILKIEDVLLCQAEGRCTVFFLRDGRKVSSYKNLMEYSYLYNNNPYFLRISRSHIINFEHVRKVIKKVGVYCELNNGLSVPVSRRKLPEFNRFISSFE